MAAIEARVTILEDTVGKHEKLLRGDPEKYKDEGIVGVINDVARYLVEAKQEKADAKKEKEAQRKFAKVQLISIAVAIAVPIILHLIGLK